MNALLYGIHNEASAPELTPQWLEQTRSDIQSAYDTVFAPRYGVLPATIQIGAPLDGRVLHLVNDIPEAPGALAFHTVDDMGRPTLRLGVETIRSVGGNLLDEITKAMTHEIFETACNPFVSLYCYVAGKPAMLSYETCDPVQGGGFRHGSTLISNFVLPAYWDAEDRDGPYDQCGELSAPLSCAPGGYLAWSDNSQTYGEHVSAAKREQIAKYGRCVK